LQPQRFELKYLVDEAITPWVRDFVSSYLDLDEYGAGRPNLSYPVHSLYLDSDDLKLLQACANGTKNRFKLRLRYYEERPGTPVFFEIKSRMDNCILKERCAVNREAVPLLLAGQLPDPDQVLSREGRHLATLQRFNLLLHQLNARPKAHNTYLREAWVSRHDNSVRVTLDRKVRIEPQFIAQAVTEMKRPTRIFGEFVILEMKFTNRFPNWFEHLVRRFSLMRLTASKYGEGMLVLGESRFHDGDRAFDWRNLAPREVESVAQSETASLNVE